MRHQPVGYEEGEYIVMRCPRDLIVSTPQSVWAEDRAKLECFAYTLGRRIAPAQARNLTQVWLSRSERLVQEAALEQRDKAIFRESQAHRSYAAIGREHGITDQRVHQIVHRERRRAAHFLMAIAGGET